MKNILEINNLYKSFGGLSAVANANLCLQTSELVSLIGPNGAGKTTVFNLITGVYKPDQGAILFDGADISGMLPYAICRERIARTFQNIRLFPGLTVLDNVKVALHKAVTYSLVKAILQTNSF